jgi:hypothetical protein
MIAGIIEVKTQKLAELYTNSYSFQTFFVLENGGASSKVLFVRCTHVTQPKGVPSCILFGPIQLADFLAAMAKANLERKRTSGNHSPN